MKDILDNYLGSGWKTYAAALGLLGLAVYQLTQGDYVNGLESLLAALAAFGIRHALEK